MKNKDLKEFSEFQARFIIRGVQKSFFSDTDYQLILFADADSFIFLLFDDIVCLPILESTVYLQLVERSVQNVIYFATISNVFILPACIFDWSIISIIVLVTTYARKYTVRQH